MIERNLLFSGAGAGIGITGYVLGEKFFKQYLPTLPLIPAPWNGWPGYGLIFGGVLTGLSFFKKLSDIRYFLLPMGLSMITSSLLDGVFAESTASAMRMRRNRSTGLRLSPRVMQRQNQVSPTPTGVRSSRIYA